MKQYRVISQFAERDDKGVPTGRQPEKDAIVNLSDSEAARLIKAKCVLLIETETVSAPENRVYKLVKNRGYGNRGRR